MTESNDALGSVTAAHPMQEVVLDPHGIPRFQENRIVCFLLDFARSKGIGLNELACLEFSDEDRAQVAQLMGYSVSGYKGLPYAKNVEEVCYKGELLLHRKD